MLSNIFNRLLTSARPMQNYQQHFIRLLSTSEASPKENMSSNRETGIVKRFSKDKGYGFISKNSDGSDCFVHFKSINSTGFKTLEQGQEVEFTTVQGEKGVEARDVSVVNAGSSRPQFGGDSYNNNSTSSRFGFGGGSSRRQTPSVYEFGGSKSSKFHGGEEEDSTSIEKNFNFNSGLTNSTMDNLFSSRQGPAENDRKRQIGSIKRWSNERGFGFIRRTSGGPDLFCHVRSLRNGLQSLDEGQTVEYRIHRTEKGDEARDVTLLDEENSAARQQDNSSVTNSNERQTGTVKRWLSEKGYGFLRRDDGGSDVFIHQRDLPDGTTSLEDGQAVEFNIKSGDKGEQAENVTVRDEP